MFLECQLQKMDIEEMMKLFESTLQQVLGDLFKQDEVNHLSQSKRPLLSRSGKALVSV